MYCPKLCSTENEGWPTAPQPLPEHQKHLYVEDIKELSSAFVLPQISFHTWPKCKLVPISLLESEKNLENSSKKHETSHLHPDTTTYDIQRRHFKCPYSRDQLFQRFCRSIQFIHLPQNPRQPPTTAWVSKGPSCLLFNYFSTSFIKDFYSTLKSREFI